MRPLVGFLAALIGLAAVATVGGCRGKGEDPLIDGHVTAVVPDGR